MFGQAVLPPDRLAARVPKHPRTEIPDEPGLFGQWDELRGRQQAAHRVLPPNERLDPFDPVIVDADEGLVEEAELVVLDRDLELVLRPHALERSRTHVLIEELEA